MELPGRTAPSVFEPRKMFIFSHPKVGKTSLAAALPNSLIVDLEGGAGFYDSARFDLRDFCLQESKTPKAALEELCNSIRKKVKEDGNGKSPYDFLIVDTTSIMEDIARALATEIYKGTVQGKAFQGKDVVSELAQGAGYEYLRQGFIQLYKLFHGTYNKCIIFLGHVKTASIQKDGKDLSARDIQLTGKLKQLLTSDSDAIAFMYRRKSDNVNILSFKTSETDLATGSRLPYLANREFEISEYKDNTLHTKWELIFPSIKK